jgi:DMSO/TMAO reductase YedYZ molybdopterin-dependent catalytic subunit
MKQSSKAVIVVFAVLAVLAVPLYFYTRPSTVEAGTIQIVGNVDNPQNVTLAQLESYPVITIQAKLTSGGNPADNGVFNYTGVLLRDILSQAQVSANATSVYIQASDGYGATISLKDARSDSTLIAYSKDGSPLTALKSGGEGPYRLVVGEDTYAQRWVKGVIALKVS